jgi:hypothetical protein
MMEAKLRLLQDPYDVISEKTAFFIGSALETSDLT